MRTQHSASRPVERTLPLLVLLTVAACGADGANRTWSTNMDTLPGGAVQVVNTPPDAGASPTWTLVEELRIGALDQDGPNTFGLLKGLAVLSDGRIAVLEAQAQDVRIFSADGAHLATHGREGPGPGELQGAWGLMRAADDRLWVPDHSNDRMTVFDPDSGLVRTYPMPVFLYGYVWRGAMGVDGRIFKPSITIEPPRRYVLRVWSTEMVLLDSLPMRDTPEYDPEDPPGSFVWSAPDGRSRSFFGVPFYPQGRDLVDAHGRVWTASAGDPTYRLERWVPGGDTTLVLETLRPPVPVGAQERDSAISALRERLGELGAPDQDWSKIPQVHPAVLSMFLSDEGRLWVRTPSTDGSRTYDVYRDDGRYVGTAVTTLPVLEYVPPTVRGDRIWAVVTDELDVPFVVRARLESLDEGSTLASPAAMR